MTRTLLLLALDLAGLGWLLWPPCLVGHRILGWVGLQGAVAGGLVAGAFGCLIMAISAVLAGAVIKLRSSA